MRPDFFSRISLKVLELQDRWRLFRITRQISKKEFREKGKKTVLFFNASTRIHNISLNAAYAQLAAWGLRLSGINVSNFVCQAGMSRCVLGTDPDDPMKPPPCASCIAQSKRLYEGGDIHWFRSQENSRIRYAMEGLRLDKLIAFNFEGLPLGEFAVHSLRWVLRRNDLMDDEPTRFLMRHFILSGYHVGEEFSKVLEQVNPSVVVVFNGMMFPEAVARRIAMEQGFPVVTHEVSFQPLGGFFTIGEATAYPIEIPDAFEMDERQNARLDAYLEERFQGKFSMAGINFWPEIRGLDEDLLAKIDAHEQVVPVFTNVIFDTSQPHANSVFDHMFSWLDHVLEVIRNHPETLFVIRAHPDEMRPGTRKQARQNVRQWIDKNKALDLENVVFIGSQEYISSYELVQRAKFVMVYNSSIGLEATLLGTPVLIGGRARYTQYPTVFFPKTPHAYQEQAEKFLAADKIEIPKDFQRNARRFMYYQLFRTSLPFDSFIETHRRGGYVRFKPFSVEQLLPENSPAIRVIRKGLLEDKTFLLEDEA